MLDIRESLYAALLKLQAATRSLSKQKPAASTISLSPILYVTGGPPSPAMLL